MSKPSRLDGMVATKSPEPALPVKIDQRVPITALHSFKDYFHGFEKVPAVRAVFGDETDRVLARQKVEFVSSRWVYMGVNNDDGHIIIGTYHLRNSQLKILYLDIVHELFHVKQHLEGKNLFPDGYEYVDSPIEVPAYRHTVQEAKRIGMSYGEIEEYLKVEWITQEQHARLARSAGLEADMKPVPEVPLTSIRIVREAPVALHPFSRYFRGFEKVEAVEVLFGAETKDVIERLRVEFFSARFGIIGVSDEDGHIIAGSHYVRDSSPTTVYLDLIFALHQVKRFQEGRPPFNVRWGAPDNPAALSAYRATVQEARRLGMTDSQISKYLRTVWITDDQHRKLLKAVGVKGTPGHTPG